MFRPVYVYGAGALGSALGALLSKRTQVTLLARPDHAAAIAAQGGLRLLAEHAGLYPLQATPVAHPPEPSAIVLVTVKAFDLELALHQLAPRLDSSHVVVVLQNGLGIRRLAEGALGRPVIRAVTFTAAAYLGPGQVALNAIGKTYLPAASEVRALWQACDMPVEEVADIETYVWRKLAINAVINPLSALLGVPNGALLALAETARPLVDELVQVARREGQPLEAGETLAKVLASMRQTARNTSSMLQDIRAGRRTEIDWINGSIVERAGRHGIDVPRHRLLVDLIHFVESRGRRETPVHTGNVHV